MTETMSGRSGYMSEWCSNGERHGRCGSGECICHCHDVVRAGLWFTADDFLEVCSNRV